MASRWPQRRRRTDSDYRSGLEEQECGRLDAKGVRYEYEPFRIPFTPAPKLRHYTPDVVLLDNGIVIELKGLFATQDRQKHLAIREAYPGLDIRIVFSNSKTRISKQSKTTYGDWCRHKDFLYADKTIPDAWLREKPNRASLAIIKRLMEGT